MTGDGAQTLSEYVDAIHPRISRFKGLIKQPDRSGILGVQFTCSRTWRPPYKAFMNLLVTSLPSYVGKSDSCIVVPAV